MVSRLVLGDIEVDVVFKAIKNVHLSVHPPTGRVRVSAPLRMSMGAIRMFTISKLGWIRQQRKKLQEQERETPYEYLDRESHYVWGKRYLLKVVQTDNVPQVELKHRELILRVRPGSNQVAQEANIAHWYRQQIKNAVPALISRWEPLLGVEIERFYVQRMKTLWGSCNFRARTIRINTELAKKPKGCLEYIVVHEMVHVLEPTHNALFIALMEQFMPNWRIRRDVLNRLPIRHEDWLY